MGGGVPHEIEGVLVGLLEAEVKPIPRITFPISPAYLLVLPPVTMIALPGLFASAHIWNLLGYYALIVVALCSIARQPSPGRLTQGLTRLGDASYCTYLFHLIITSAVARIFGRLIHSSAVSPALLILIALTAVVFAHLLGLAIHSLVELRIIKFFRNFSPPRIASHPPILYSSAQQLRHSHVAAINPRPRTP